VLEIRLLGPVEVWVGGGWLDAGPPQRRAVLAALAVEAGRPLLTEALIDRVWGERPPGRPRAAVHAHITLIRRLLKKANDAEGNQPPVALVYRGGSYLLRVDPMCVDLLRFRDLVASARDRERSDAERARLLHDAVDLWRSPALADLPGAWPARMRESWALERLDAAVDWARSEVRLGHHEQVVSPVRALAAAYPVAEPLVAVLMQALAVTGRVSEALDCYATARTRLADLLGADPGAELRELHQVILRGDLEQLRASGAPQAPPTKAVARGPVLWGPVPPRNLFFTGREQALADLHARLTGPAADGGTLVAVSALAGMGGVGKTQLAAEYAHRNAGAYRLVWWMTAETHTQAVAGLAALADALGLPPGIPAQRQARLWEVLAGRDDWLLVYDNATDPGTLAAVLPPRVSGRVLVTSRARLPRLPTVDVGVFDRAESVALLHHHLPQLPTADADRLAATLADLPLAVDQAGAYLTEAPLGVDSYLHLLADQPQLALAEATPDHAGLAATVAAAHTHLAALHPAAADLLDQLAFLAPDPIPLAEAGPTSAGLVVAAEAGRMEATERLRLPVRLALARRTATGVQLHRLVAALLRARLDSGQQAATLGRCLRLLASATPGDPEDPAAWPAWAVLAPHIQAANAHLATGGPPAPAEPEPFRALLADCVWYLHRSGQFHPARQLATALGRWAGGDPGPDDPHTLRVATALAVALAVLGEAPAARELAKDTLTRSRRVLGDNHPTTLYLAAVLATALAALGEAPAAQDLAKETLTRSRRVLGNDHPTNLLTAAVLAGTQLWLGEAPPARNLAKDTLARSRRALGNEHPTTLYSAAVLATALVTLGEAPAARNLAKDTLARSRQVLGDNHPTTLYTAAALTGALATLGEAPAARDLAKDTLTRCRQVLGNDHATTLLTAAALAGTLLGLGQAQPARNLAEDTLTRSRPALGNDHPATLYSAAVLAGALATLGQAPAARALAEDTLARCLRVLGNEHPATRATEEVLRRLDQEGQQARQR